jgi:hypothetical protein
MARLISASIRRRPAPAASPYNRPFAVFLSVPSRAAALRLGVPLKKWPQRCSRDLKEEVCGRLAAFRTTADYPGARWYGNALALGSSLVSPAMPPAS